MTQARRWQEAERKELRDWTEEVRLLLLLARLYAVKQRMLYLFCIEKWSKQSRRNSDDLN